MIPNCSNNPSLIALRRTRQRKISIGNALMLLLVLCVQSIALTRQDAVEIGMIERALEAITEDPLSTNTKLIPEFAKTTQDVDNPQNHKPIPRSKWLTKAVRLNVSPDCLRFEKAQVGWPTVKNFTVENVHDTEVLKVYAVTSDQVQVQTLGIKYERSKLDERVRKVSLTKAREMLEHRKGDVGKHEERINFVKKKVLELQEKLHATKVEYEKNPDDELVNIETHEMNKHLRDELDKMAEMVKETEDEIQESVNILSEIVNIGGNGLKRPKDSLRGKKPIFTIKPGEKIEIQARHAPHVTGRGRGTLSVQTNRGDVLVPFTFLVRPNEYRVQPITTTQVLGVPHDYDLSLYNPILRDLNVTDVWTRSEFITIDANPQSSSSSSSSTSSSTTTSSGTNDNYSDNNSDIADGWLIKPGTSSRIARITLIAPSHQQQRSYPPGSIHSFHEQAPNRHAGVVYVKTEQHQFPFEFPIILEGVDNTIFATPKEIDFGAIIVSEENRKGGSKKSKERRPIFITNGDMWPIRVTSVSSKSTDVRPQLVSGRGVSVPPGETVEVARVWYDVKSRKASAESLIHERIRLTIESGAGRNFHIEVLARVLVYSDVPLRPVERYALNFPTIEGAQSIEEKELLLKQEKGDKFRKKDSKEPVKSTVFPPIKMRSITFQHMGVLPMRFLGFELPHTNASRTSIVEFPLGQKLYSGNEVTLSFMDKIPLNSWKHHKDKEDKIMIVTDLLKFPMRIERYDARLRCVNTETSVVNDPKAPVEDILEGYDEAAESERKSSTCHPISFGIIGPRVNRTRVITLSNPHSQPLTISSTWLDMPGAKVARLTTFDPEAMAISGWNGQMLYVFEKSHKLEDFDDDNTVHNAPCLENEERFTDMPGGCRQNYKIARVDKNEQQNTKNVANNKKSDESEIKAPEEEEEDDLDEFSPLAKMAWPRNKKNKGQQVQVKNKLVGGLNGEEQKWANIFEDDFVVPARGRAIFHIQATVGEDDALIKSFSDLGRTNYTFGVLTNNRWTRVPITASFSTGTLVPANDIVSVSTSLGKRHANVPIEVVSTHSVPVLTRVSVLQHSLDDKRGSQKGVVVRHNKNGGLIEPNIREPQISAWAKLDLSSMHREIFGEEDLTYDDDEDDDIDDEENASNDDSANVAAAEEWLKKKSTFAFSSPTKSEAKKLRVRLDKIRLLESKDAFRMKATVVVSNDATSLGDVDTVDVLVNLRRPGILESLSSTDNTDYKNANYAPSSFSKFDDDEASLDIGDSFSLSSSLAEKEEGPNHNVTPTFIDSIGAGQRSLNSKTLRVHNPTSKKLCFDAEPYIFPGASYMDTPDLAIATLLRRGGFFSFSKLLSSLTLGLFPPSVPKIGSIREGESAFLFEIDRKLTSSCIEPDQVMTLGEVFFAPPKSAIKDRVLKSSLCVRNSFTLFECVDVRGQVSEAFSYVAAITDKEAKKATFNNVSFTTEAFETVTSSNFLAVFFAICFAVTASLFALSVANQNKLNVQKESLVGYEGEKVSPVSVLESTIAVTATAGGESPNTAAMKNSSVKVEMPKLSNVRISSPNTDDKPEGQVISSPVSIVDAKASKSASSPSSSPKVAAEAKKPLPPPRRSVDVETKPSPPSPTGKSRSPRAAPLAISSVERESFGRQTADESRVENKAANMKYDEKKQSYDKSAVEEAKRNAAAALAKPARLGNTNKLVDLNKYVAPKAASAANAVTKKDPAMPVDVQDEGTLTRKTSLLPPWGRKYVPEKISSNNTVDVVENKSLSVEVPRVPSLEQVQQHYNHIGSASSSPKFVPPPGFDSKPMFQPQPNFNSWAGSQPAPHPNQQQMSPVQPPQATMHASPPVQASPSLIPAHLNMASQEKRGAFDMFGGFGSASIFSEREESAPRILANTSLERTKIEEVIEEEDEGLRFHLPDMDFLDGDDE